MWNDTVDQRQKEGGVNSVDLAVMTHLLSADTTFCIDAAASSSSICFLCNSVKKQCHPLETIIPQRTSAKNLQLNL